MYYAYIMKIKKTYNYEDMENLKMLFILKKNCKISNLLCLNI